MSHVQTQILDCVERLLMGLPLTGSNVFRGSVHPETPGSMPGVTVSAGAESNAGGGFDSTVKSVALELGIYVGGDDTVVSNGVALEVAGALYSGDVTLAGLATSVVYGGSSREYRAGAAFKHTVLRVVYVVDYETGDGDDGTAK